MIFFKLFNSSILIEYTVQNFIFSTFWKKTVNQLDKKIGFLEVQLGSISNMLKAEIAPCTCSARRDIHLIGSEIFVCVE